ncbi:MAG: SpoIIE family protein phosphatase, partial [Actinomycetota bacterium]|nr:SpoIIE family protein phosphatase [Actinomycetota bacterium]
MPDVIGQSDGERMLLHILETSHLTRPNELPGLIADAAGQIGADDVAVYVVDYAQHLLVPLPVAGAQREALRIDATLAGLALRRVELQRSDEVGRTRLWIPVTDGTDRVGVLGLVLDTQAAAEETTITRARGLAALVAELLNSRKTLADAFGAAARREEMSLAAEMQWQLFPPLTYADHDVMIAAGVEPAYDVGGDGFDFAVDGDVARFAIFDAMGHGLQASLLCVTAVAAYRNSRRAGGGLVASAVAVDAAISEAFGPDQFVTVVLAELRLDTGALRVV